jgi:hypothetical protein
LFLLSEDKAHERRQILASGSLSQLLLHCTMRDVGGHYQRVKRNLCGAIYFSKHSTMPSQASAVGDRVFCPEAWLARPALLLEYEVMLTRPTMLRMIGIGRTAVMAVLDQLAGLFVPVALDYRWRPGVADPADDMSAPKGKPSAASPPVRPGHASRRGTS